MSDLPEQESEFRRLLQQTPLDDAPRAEHRDALREQSLQRFDEAQRVPAASWWKLAYNHGREIMSRPASRWIAAVAACFLVVAAGLLLPGQQSTAHAFNMFAEALVTAKTARFQMEVQIEGQPKQSFKAYFRAPGKYRQELPNTYNISDLKAGKVITVNSAAKKVVVLNFQGAPPKQVASDYFEQLRDLLSESRDAQTSQYERLGEKEIDGKKAVGFRLDSTAATVTLWGDPATGHPVRIDTAFSGLPRTSVAMTGFEIDVPLDDALFDMTPPAGYDVQSVDVDASAPGEGDLVAAFKAYSDMADGEFPDSMDMTGINQAITKDITSRKEKISDEDMQSLMKRSVSIGRGFGFAMNLPDSSDAHYAGSGIKRGAVDRPIFWHKPAGAAAYRVIYADLSVKDSPTAPRVDGAKRLEKASKTAPAEQK